MRSGAASCTAGISSASTVPSTTWALVGIWALTRRSIAAYQLYATGGRVASYAAALLLCAALVRRKSLVLVLPFLLPWIDLRVGLALAGLLLLVLWLRSRKPGALARGGAARGDVAALQPGVRARARPLGGRGLRRDARGQGRGRHSPPGSPPWSRRCSPGSHVHGALAPMLHDLDRVSALHDRGLRQASLPIARREPAAAPRGPARAGRARSASRLRRARRLRGALCCSPCRSRRCARASRSPGCARRRSRSQRIPRGSAWRSLALFGALAFRSALGRSDITHILMILAPPALLVVIGFDRLVGAWSADPARRPLVATRAVALILLVLHGGLLEQAQAAALAAATRSATSRRSRAAGYAPRGDPPRAGGLALGAHATRSRTSRCSSFRTSRPTTT